MNRLGEYRHRVDIEKRRLTEAGTGDPVVTWVPVAKNWPAKIELVSAREFIAGQVLASQVTATVSIPWHPEVDATMRFKRHTHGSTPRTFEIYNIAGILPDKTGRRELVCPSTMGVNDG